MYVCGSSVHASTMVKFYDYLECTDEQYAAFERFEFRISLPNDEQEEEQIQADDDDEEEIEPPKKKKERKRKRSAKNKPLTELVVADNTAACRLITIAKRSTRSAKEKAKLAIKTTLQKENEEAEASQSLAALSISPPEYEPSESEDSATDEDEDSEVETKQRRPTITQECDKITQKELQQYKDRLEDNDRDGDESYKFTVDDLPESVQSLSFFKSTDTDTPAQVKEAETCRRAAFDTCRFMVKSTQKGIIVNQPVTSFSTMAACITLMLETHMVANVLVICISESVENDTRDKWMEVDSTLKVYFTHMNYILSPKLSKRKPYNDPDDVADFVKNISNGEKFMLIIDDAHAVGNKHTILYKQILSLASKATRVMCFTTKPVSNGVDDLLDIISLSNGQTIIDPEPLIDAIYIADSRGNSSDLARRFSIGIKQKVYPYSVNVEIHEFDGEAGVMFDEIKRVAVNKTARQTVVCVPQKKDLVRIENGLKLLDQGKVENVDVKRNSRSQSREMNRQSKIRRFNEKTTNIIVTTIETLIKLQLYGVEYVYIMKPISHDTFESVKLRIVHPNEENNGSTLHVYSVTPAAKLTKAPQVARICEWVIAANAIETEKLF